MDELQQIGVGLAWVLGAFVGVTAVAVWLFVCCAVWHMMYVVVVKQTYRTWKEKR